MNTVVVFLFVLALCSSMQSLFNLIVALVKPVKTVTMRPLPSPNTLSLTIKNKPDFCQLCRLKYKLPIYIWAHEPLKLAYSIFIFIGILTRFVPSERTFIAKPDTVQALPTFMCKVFSFHFKTVGPASLRDCFKKSTIKTLKQHSWFLFCSELTRDMQSLLSLTPTRNSSRNEKEKIEKVIIEAL